MSCIDEQIQEFKDDLHRHLTRAHVPDWCMDIEPGIVAMNRRLLTSQKQKVLELVRKDKEEAGKEYEYYDEIIRKYNIGEYSGKVSLESAKSLFIHHFGRHQALSSLETQIENL